MKRVIAFTLSLLLALSLAGCTERPVPVPTAAPETTGIPEPADTPEPTATASLAPTPEPTPEPTPTPTPEPEASELDPIFSVATQENPNRLRDGSEDTYLTLGSDAGLTVECAEPMGALYLCWYREPGTYTVTAGETSFTAGENDYLYEYIPLPAPAKRVTLTFTANVRLSEVQTFTPGTAPAGVQVWLPPYEQGEVDVLTFPTHADDDVIFFGAEMVCCVDRGLAVQVCYMCNHYDDFYDWHTRPQELLNALWAMGIRHYPVIGPFPDYYVMSLADATAKFGETEVIAWQVEQLRRFQPLVVMGHDREGEYGHGGHRLNALCLEQAVPMAADGTAFPESAARWGVWDTPKLYLHDAEENPVVLEVETPLESFGGRTAFEVAQGAMLCHESQLQYDHRPQLDNPEFPRYDCRQFGLVRTTVGVDTGNDIMEHTEGLRQTPAPGVGEDIP